MKKFAVYTCITGDYDEVKELAFQESGVDYYLFTNNKNIISSSWKVIYIENEGLDNIRLARKIKVLGHPILEQYDITVWLDGASYIKKSIKEFIANYCDLDQYCLVGFKHRERDCIYEEALECVKVRKEKKEVIQRQIKKYKQEGYPEHNGLIESTILIRKHLDRKLRQTMMDWFSEISDFSYRDQLSFNYVVSRSKLNYDLLDMNVFDNEYFGWKKHINKKSLGGYSVYFGSDEDFDYDSLYIGTYDKNLNKYTAKFKCPKKCNVFKFEFATCTGILFSDLCVLGKNICDRNLVNYGQYFEFSIFDGGIPTLFVYGDFKKGQSFEISLVMDFIKEEQYLELLHRFNIALIETSNQLNSQKKVSFLRKIRDTLKK